MSTENLENSQMTTYWVVGKTDGFGKSFMEEAAPELGLEDQDLERQGGTMAEGRPALLTEKARMR